MIERMLPNRESLRPIGHVYTTMSPLRYIVYDHFDNGLEFAEILIPFFIDEISTGKQHV